MENVHEQIEWLHLGMSNLPVRTTEFEVSLRND